jgi:hypothetical protein
MKEKEEVGEELMRGNCESVFSFLFSGLTGYVLQ